MDETTKNSNGREFEDYQRDLDGRGSRPLAEHIARRFAGVNGPPGQLDGRCAVAPGITDLRPVGK